MENNISKSPVAGKPPEEKPPVTGAPPVAAPAQGLPALAGLPIAPAGQAGAPVLPAMAGVPAPTVTFDEFKKMDVRIGKVLSVENHPKADKLYILKVDIGSEVRQIVAGLRPYMGPERLLNKHIVMIVNLQPAILRGVQSNGMILAASADTPTGREVIILQPEKDMPPGSKIS